MILLELADKMKSGNCSEATIPRGVFMHLCMKIPRVASKNPITEGDFHGFLPVSVRVLNRYEIRKKQKEEGMICYGLVLNTSAFLKNSPSMFF